MTDKELRYQEALEFVRDELSGVFDYAGDVNKTVDKMEKVMLEVITALSPLH